MLTNIQNDKDKIQIKYVTSSSQSYIYVRIYLINIIGTITSLYFMYRLECY